MNADDVLYGYRAEPGVYYVGGKDDPWFSTASLAPTRPPGPPRGGPPGAWIDPSLPADNPSPVEPPLPTALDRCLKELRRQVGDDFHVRIREGDGGVTILEVQRGNEPAQLVEWNETIARGLLAAARRGHLAAAIQPHTAQEAQVQVSWSRRSNQLERLSRGCTAFAALLAGRQRPHLRDEWAAILCGEDGGGLSRTRRSLYVLGFLWAALRMRAHDGLGALWRPVDWVLTVESRTNAMITGVVGLLVIYIQAKDGFHALVTDGWEPCALLGGGLFVLARWLRRVRGIELADRPADE